MTPTVERRRLRKATERRTFDGELLAMVRELREQSRILRWPAPERYADDPVGFCEEILGFEPWSRQVEILEALRDRGFVAVASGRKTGKTRVATAAALHFYATVPGGQVYFVAPTADQVQDQHWPEISRLHRESGRCLECKLADPNGPRPCPHSTPLDGVLSPLAEKGLRGSEERLLKNKSSKKLESVSGYSAPQLWIVDESAGVTDAVFEAIDGNDLGAAVKLLTLGNPTRNRGRFFELFHNERQQTKFHTLQVSSEEAAQARDRRGNHPRGLATEAKIEEYREIWGEDSPLYIVHVLGQFAIAEDGAVFSVAAIAEAQARWHEDPGEGRLYIGVDPAGATGVGDETAIGIRRGTKLIAIETQRGLDEDGHLVAIQDVIERYKKPKETPVVVVDREGSIGSVLHARIIEYLDRFRAPRRAPWEYVPVKASLPAERMPQAYPRVRDELIANMERWLRTGSIPDDDKLAKELNSIKWIEQVDQRLKATSKDELRKLLERSPDRMDCLALAVWDSLSLRVQDGADLPPSAAAAVARDRASLAARRTPAGGWEGFGDDSASNTSRRDPHKAMRDQRGRGRRF